MNIDVETNRRWLASSPQHHIIAVRDESYPPLLREIIPLPRILYVRGNVAALHAPLLAMVGSRNPSHNGLELARALAAELVAAGLGIVSGLALGIDGACHRGALDGHGQTVAILGTGVNNIYPKRHYKLAEDILAAGGALVSEFPLDTAAQAGNFPQRNRIISGLSFGTLVVEATENSGSLITARCAMEQGREVFAIPGAIANPLARGCHKLLRQGAKLVETAADVFEELGAWRAALKPRVAPQFSQDMGRKKENQLDSNCRKLLECVDYNVTTVDALIARSSFSAAQVMAMLPILELAGAVCTEPGGYTRAK